MSGSDGFLVTRSGQRLCRTPFVKPDPFPFLKLPSEVRNMTYRYALAQGATSTSCGHSSGLISIISMDPDRYKRQKTRKRFRARRSYTAMTEGRCDCCCPGHWTLQTTTYILSPHLQVPTSGLLCVNRQITSEATPIFYGENTFLFPDMAAVIPFLQDRSVIARRNIRDIKLMFELYYDDGHHIDRQAEWVRAFGYIARHLKPSALGVRVLNATFRWWEPVKFAGRKREWLRALAHINNLDRLEFFLDYAGREEYIEGTLDGTTDEDELHEEVHEFHFWMAETEVEYEKYLKARMLKKKQRTFDKWLQGHICTDSCNEIKKGRAAAKVVGLPRSDTDGLWILPDVDLDTLYEPSESTGGFDKHDEYWSDSETDCEEVEEATS
ncbi:MAG: hypothetical protein Q9201_000424 [Fulgogasparrea decipioides]